MKVDVYGKHLEIQRSGSEWVAFYMGNEGKKRKADDIKIPKDIKEDDLVEYIADLCHEWSRPGNSEVKIIDQY
ncbi:MAG: hypothetical protein MI976_04710 [Pseudomonadales bacterium]|nr:hypothetical protein [Pseudomonadales bacterium]